MRYTTGTRLRLLLGVSILASTAAPAWADTTPAGLGAAAAETPAAAAPDAPTAEPVAADGAQLEDIVVTATKRETNLQKTPIAIAVMSSQNLSDRHVQSLLDLADGAVPSLRVATFEARQTALTIGIRGIVPLDANQPAREQGVGIYIDGVYLGRQHGLNAALFDLERVEVLKGPQGTLFGRNTEGGALSLVSKAPSGEFGLRATAGISNYGGYNGDFHLDLPRLGDFAFKIDGVIQYQGATTKDPLPGSTGFNYYDRRGGRAAVRWTPSSNFTADLSVDRGYDANTAFYSQLLNYNPRNLPVTSIAQQNANIAAGRPAVPAGSISALPPLVQVNGDTRMSVADIGVPQQPSIDKTFGTTLRLAWKVAPDLELRSISAYREVSSIQWDNSGGAHRPPVFTPNGGFSRYSLADLYQHQWSQEFQAVGSTSNIDYVAGLYYFYEKARDDAATPSSNRWNADGTAYTILDPTPTEPGHRSLDRASVASSNSYAAYGQATYTPSFMDEALHLTVGGRYTHDDKSGKLFIVNNIPRPYAYKEKEDRFNPMVTLAYDPTPGLNFYAKYATGYRSGGASSRSITYRSFGPEDIKSYEIGAKTEFLDNHVRLNVAGYIADRKNSQIDFSSIQFDRDTNSSRNTIETVNAPGTTKIRGIEADLTVNPFRGLTLTGSYAYTYTKVPPALNTTLAVPVLQQVYIVFTPRNAASGAIDYTIPIGNGPDLRFHLDANYSQSTQTFDQFAMKNDASFIVNGRISLANIDLGRNDTKLTISAWSRNLFNEAHVYRRDPSNESTLGDYGNFNAPRTFGLEGSIKL
ncbi:TonB-dependent receptor [Sphingomonas sp. So64.6b]|uniref:TonB-dependent receptor n=1 Tax=Sphingomonas sp. So64.6b TaxID=2997354 RepID=UPI001602D1EB|nr:TonB-dependent receptor [Sphingomonas sp. So64.6b]QNA82982.1 TonB-dependent receptor [Sphingomonas sp. So64.6b]